MEDFNPRRFIQDPSSEDLKRSKDLTFLFITAILTKDIVLLESLLCKKFTYFDDKTMEQTLAYFKSQFSQAIPEDYYSKEVVTMYCKVCKPGTPVLVFHKGFWPVLEDEPNIPKSLLLTFKDGFISDIDLCFGFCSAHVLQELAIQN